MKYIVVIIYNLVWGIYRVEYIRSDKVIRKGLINGIKGYQMWGRLGDSLGKSRAHGDMFILDGLGSAWHFCSIILRALLVACLRFFVVL